MPIISVSMPEELLERMDALIRKLGYTGRSELVREAVRRLIEAYSAGLRRGRGPWLLLVVTRHSGGGVAADARVANILHAYRPVVKTYLHQSLDEEKCVNVAIVEADEQVLGSLLGELRRLKGVERAYAVPV